MLSVIQCNAMFVNGVMRIFQWLLIKQIDIEMEDGYIM